jgi:hypothetical protein
MDLVYQLTFPIMCVLELTVVSLFFKLAWLKWSVESNSIMYRLGMMSFLDVSAICPACNRLGERAYLPTSVPNGGVLAEAPRREARRTKPEIEDEKNISEAD